MPATANRIDVRAIAPSERHPLIFRTFDELPVGGTLEIFFDHDPAPLYFQFDRARPGQFDWLYVEVEPGKWHVRIARTADGTPGSAA